METAINIASVIALIMYLVLFLVIIQIAVNTRDTNRLLRALLNEKNPKRFKLKEDGEFIDKKFKKEIDLSYPTNE